MKLPVYDLTGKQVKEITADKDIFNAKINQPLLAQAVRVYLSNQRLASAKAKTRAEVDRTGKKIYKQKGTGNARHGSKKAPIFVGGGKALGPTKEHHYKLDLPKKMKIAALKSALSLLASEKKISLIDEMAKIKEPKTKVMDRMFAEIYKDELISSIGLVISKDMKIAHKSTRNLAYVKCLDDQSLNTYEVLNSSKLLISLESLKALKDRLTA